ncbi:hypothetical protein G5I_08743 [Acromyrmex echinatior]|uniref:Uncharacterized protein n=1 Tax=Acromyrmex echinatior TaxID=103372 RepID=F4WSC1_ACREC|nr:hypothetical protein G5I_08743 [Acromyrmex echinatior]
MTSSRPTTAPEILPSTTVPLTTLTPTIPTSLVTTMASAMMASATSMTEETKQKILGRLAISATLTSDATSPEEEEEEERPGLGVGRRPLMTDPRKADREPVRHDGEGHSTPQGRREPRIGASRPRGGLKKKIPRSLEFRAPGHATGMTRFPRLAEPLATRQSGAIRPPRGDNEPCVHPGGLAPGT